MSFSVAMSEIRTQHLTGSAAHHVFAGDEIDGINPPLVLLSDSFLDPFKISLRHLAVPRVKIQFL
jgi:hypothetical protein